MNTADPRQDRYYPRISRERWIILLNEVIEERQNLERKQVDIGLRAHEENMLEDLTALEGDIEDYLSPEGKE